MQNFSLLKLYLIFIKIGAILLGGGYVILPILTSELCDKRNLIDKSELADYFALSQSLPGIVAANISIFTGYKLGGKFGAVAAMLGIITIPFLTIIAFASVLNTVAGNSYISSIFWGIGIAVMALILLTVRDMWKQSNTDIFFYIIFLLSLLLILFYKFSPVTTILFCSAFGVLIKTIERKRREK